MAVDDNRRKITRYKPDVDSKVFNNRYGGFMRGFSWTTFIKYKIYKLFMRVDNYVFIQPDKSTPDIQL